MVTLLHVDRITTQSDYMAATENAFSLSSRARAGVQPGKTKLPHAPGLSV